MIFFLALLAFAVVMFCVAGSLFTWAIVLLVRRGANKANLDQRLHERRLYERLLEAQQAQRQELTIKLVSDGVPVKVETEIKVEDDILGAQELEG